MLYNIHNYAIIFFSLYSTDGFPPDGTPVQIIHTYQIGLTVSYNIIAIVGLSFATTCAVFNFVFRNKR